jgi:hypothetical protein
LITDFTYVATDDAGTANPTDQIAFGNYTDSFSGGTTYWPTESTVTSDVTGDAWHLSGSVSDYTGFGFFYFPDKCARFDASAFAGISFSIKGTIGGTGRTLTMVVGTAADQIPRSWFVGKGVAEASLPAVNFGNCIPDELWPDDPDTAEDDTVSNQYNGTCAQPTYTVPVTADGATVSVLWADLTGGSPVANPNPAELVSMSWYLSWNGSTDTAYDFDLTIDDLTFIAK